MQKINSKIRSLIIASSLLSVSDNFGQVGVGPAPYCMPAYSQTPCNQPNASNNTSNWVNDFIDSFNTTGAVNNITNNGSGCNAQILSGVTENYFYNGCPTVLRVNAGQVITCNIQSGIIYDQGFAIYVDWNNNGVFAATEQVAATPGVPMAATWSTLVFTVPAAQAAGTYKMRVRSAYFTVGTTIDPCIMYGFGETEDYPLIVGTGACPIALPIELLSFEAIENGADVEIKWSTATEINSDYFLLEKSYDNETFELVEKVAASGKSFSIKKYSVTDNDSKAKGLIYYRLKEIEKGSNHAEFSKTITLYSEKESLNFEVFPNPVGNELSLKIPKVAFGKTIFIEFFDNYGKKVLLSKNQITNDISVLNFNISSLKKGVYILKVLDETGNTLLKKNIIKD